MHRHEKVHFRAECCKKKSLAQEVRQKSDISAPLFATRPTVSGATCQGSPYTKNEYSLFYQKFDAEYFFIRQFFRKKLLFSKKTAKNCFGGAFDNFLGKEDVLRRKLT